jgi:transcription antitermination protein NusB
MLNRRILRVKAFQNLYAYEQCKGSNFNLAKDRIREAFLPDLNTMEAQNKPQLKKYAEETIDLFVKNLDKDAFSGGNDANPKVKEVAFNNINEYHKANKKDFDFLSKNMVISAERIPQLYLFSIQLLIAFGDHVSAESAKKKKISADAISGSKEDLNLSNNQLLKRIRNSASFQTAVIKQEAGLREIEQEIKQWFRDYIKPIESYQEYIRIQEPTIAQDYEVLDTILKKVIFKTDAILNFFSEKDLNWTENKSVVRSLAAKVLKNAAANSISEEDDFLPELAINWEEDKEFFQNIFNLTVKNGIINRDLIAKKTQNWDIDRIAYTDKIILSMAITEMKNFPSIPVKVSINEYIDISKTYSTPKSKQFVNGLLDVLAKELTQSGEIRKSGRGLLDNK